MITLICIFSAFTFQQIILYQQINRTNALLLYAQQLDRTQLKVVK